MADQYSLYDAKAQLSRIVRQVREGGAPVVITVHGEPAVEIRRYEPLPTDLEPRIAELIARGYIRPPKGTPRDAPWKAVASRPGALKRFLDERRED
jgi:prevent-host-death family protein